MAEWSSRAVVKSNRFVLVLKINHLPILWFIYLEHKKRQMSYLLKVYYKVA